MTDSHRHSTGAPFLDDLLEGGLIPGTLTVVVGATGIGKTQLGVQYAHAGRGQEGRLGMLFDMSARGDSQCHAEYAARLFQWTLTPSPPLKPVDLANFFDPARPHGDYLHVFDRTGRQVASGPDAFDERREWQAELNAKLRAAIAFLYGGFVRGRRRIVVDGLEPADTPAESIQFQLFEYLYHQVLRKDAEWVARDLLRESYRQHAARVAAHRYATEDISCLMLSTSAESMLEDLISRPLDQGDALSNANTLIYLGKIRQGQRLRRGLVIAKHRGSAASDQIVPYDITKQGLQPAGEH